MPTEVTTVETTTLLPTDADMLREINNAIATILQGGQSYQIGSRKLTRADLAQLYQMRKEIESGIAADENGNNGFFDDCYVAVWPGDR